RRLPQYLGAVIHDTSLLAQALDEARDFLLALLELEQRPQLRLLVIEARGVRVGTLRRTHDEQPRGTLHDVTHLSDGGAEGGPHGGGGLAECRVRAETRHGADGSDFEAALGSRVFE